MTEECKPKAHSITVFVREIVTKVIRRRKLKEAAIAYEAFLQTHPEEQAWLEAWESAELAFEDPKS